MIEVEILFSYVVVLVSGFGQNENMKSAKFVFYVPSPVFLQACPQPHFPRAFFSLPSSLPTSTERLFKVDVQKISD